MFNVFKKLMARRRQAKLVRELSDAIKAIPDTPAPKGKRWLLGLDNKWSLVDVPKPDPARRPQQRKRKARA